MKKNLRIITFAWNESYINDLLDYSIAAVLAENNLPALIHEFNCTFVILSQKEQFEHIENHQNIKKIKKICKFELISIDDLITESWQYGITLTKALHRGFLDLKNEMINTWILFLNSDFILANGSYKSLIPVLNSDESIIVSPSYCVIDEEVKPLLNMLKNNNQDILQISKRGLAKIILENKHPTIKAKIINQNLISYKYIDQLYYEVNKDIILGRQMPVAVVAMKPEVFILEPINFWDWGVIYDYCPSKKIKCLGDSDEFLMLELRHAMTQFDNILNHRIDLEYSANLMSGHLTEYQYDFLKFNLVLHSIDLPNNFKEIESQFAAEVDKYSATLVTVINKLNNSQWNYHHKYFNFYNKTRYRRLRLEKINKIIQDVKDGVENINTITLEKEYKILEKQIEEEKITLNLILDLKPLNSAPLKSKMNSINFLNRINRYLNFINRYLYKKLKLKTLKKLDNLINNAVEKNLYPKLNHNFKYKVEVLGSDENINVLVKSSKNAFIDFTNTSVLINDYKVDSLDKKCNITCFIILDKDEANIINYFSLFKFIKSKSNVFILIFNNHNFKSIEFTKKFNIFNKGYEVFLNKNVKIYNNLYFLIFINLLKLLLLFLFRDEKVNFSITKIQVKKIR